MALFVSEKNEIIAAVNADAYGMAAFNLLEDEPDPESDRGWEHEALNMIHMG